jgi:effector-binding domain-containing protein
MEITTKQEQGAACIRIRTAVANLQGELGKGYGEIMSVLGRQGVQPVGAPFAIYHNMDMNDLDVEMGFPVAAPFRAEGRIKPGSIPGGRTAVATHKGPYETMEKTYNGITAFIAEKKAVPMGLCYEVYLSDPQTTKPEDMLTEINFPLRD